ncbi:MAG: hypothetical protein MHPSP_003029, partial [Paramarteilia canceri]
MDELEDLIFQEKMCSLCNVILTESDQRFENEDYTICKNCSKCSNCCSQDEGITILKSSEGK